MGESHDRSARQSCALVPQLNIHLRLVVWAIESCPVVKMGRSEITRLGGISDIEGSRIGADLKDSTKLFRVRGTIAFFSKWLGAIPVMCSDRCGVHNVHSIACQHQLPRAFPTCYCRVIKHLV